MKRLAVLLFLLLCGCIGGPELASEHSTWEEAMADECIAVCQGYMGDKTSGPCLDTMVHGWACDIAHFPRQDVDDEPENQCHGFLSLPAHFVEVDEDCNIIRVV